jgi:hypothetical protein
MIKLSEYDQNINDCKDSNINTSRNNNDEHVIDLSTTGGQN